MPKRKLIVNADDWGQSKGINRGIIQSFEQGILTSASFMVRYPAAAEAATYSKRNPRLGIGLHVDLGEWAYKNGEWIPLYEVVSLEDKDKVENEVNRQLDAFGQLMGRKPTHIDSHQHVHLRKNLCPVFIEIAQGLNIPLRDCSKLVNYCGDFYGQLNDGSPHHVAISIEGLQQLISKLSEGYTEMACHPGLDNDVETMYGVERAIEVETLCDGRIKESISKENIELCSFENILLSKK
jgi:predicted glycoside hydrolase/deacetylase ChbG (UPF0249 family)